MSRELTGLIRHSRGNINNQILSYVIMFSISFIATSALAVVYTAPLETSFTRSDSHFTMAYVDGQTAWQIHGSNTNAYFFLKKWFGGRWSRQRLLTYGASQILRHGSAGPRQPTPSVDPLGFMGSKELAGFIGFRFMEATAEEIVTACLEGMRTGRQKDKRFIIERRDNDIYLRIRQGETSRIADQISEELRDTVFTPAQDIWRDRLYHGTRVGNVANIMRDGLEAGRKERADVHFAGYDLFSVSTHTHEYRNHESSDCTGANPVRADADI